MKNSEPSLGLEPPCGAQDAADTHKFGRRVGVPARRHGGLRMTVSGLVENVCKGLGGRAFYRRRYLRSGRFIERTEHLYIAGLAPELEGFTIAQISDLHAGPFLREGDLRQVTEAVARRCPDVVVYTGDMISHHWSDALAVLPDLAELRPPMGSFGVFGNHDYRGRQEDKIASAYGDVGIRFLRNECARVSVGGGTVGLVGLEDLEEARRVDLEGARAGLREGDVEIVLCHNPRGACAIARPRCRAILSGHTHGTQVDLPVLRRLGPQHPGLRLELDRTTLIVSRGLGVVALPLRIGVPAEVVYIRLSGRFEG